MSNKNGLFGNVRIVFRRTSPLVKCVVLATIVLCTVALISLRTAINDSKEREAAYTQKALELAQQNRALTQEIAELGTVESVKRIAERDLGLVDPNSQFFTPGN